MSRRLAIIEGQRAALAYGGADLQALVLELQAENRELRRQVADRSGQPDALSAHNATLQAHGEDLRAAIRVILDSDTGPRHGAAKRVLRALLETDIGRVEAPTLRCVQHHITKLRKAAALHE